MTVKISELPDGSNTKRFTVPGNQDDATRKFNVPPSVFNPTATKAEGRALVGEHRQMTPGATGASVIPLQIQIDNNYGDWTTPTKNTTTTKGTTIASIQVITTDVRTTSLGNSKIGLFYDTGVGIPSIPGDSVRLGIVAVNDDSERIALVEFVTAGQRVFKVVNAAWAQITDAEDNVYIHDAHGVKIGDGYHLLVLGGRNAPVTSPTRYWLVERQSANLRAFSPDYTAQVGESGDTDYAAATFDVYSTTKTYSTVASTPTYATLKSVLTNPPAAAADQIPVTAFSGSGGGGGGGSGNTSYIIGSASDYPGAPALDDVMYVFNDFSAANLGNAAYAFETGVFYCYCPATQTLPQGWQPYNASKKVIMEPGVAASFITSGTFSPARLASTTGTQDGYALTLDSSQTTMSWERIGLSYGQVTLSRSGNIYTLPSGKTWSDYLLLTFMLLWTGGSFRDWTSFTIPAGFMNNTLDNNADPTPVDIFQPTSSSGSENPLIARTSAQSCRILSNYGDGVQLWALSA